MRNRSKTECYAEVGVRIERLYERLRELSQTAGNPAGYLESEDVLHETICFLLGDARAAAITTDDAFICYFQYRYEMINYQITYDYKNLKEIHYANDLQANEEGETGEL